MEKNFSFGALFSGAFKLAIVLPLLWWLFPKLPVVRDLILLFKDLFRHGL